MKKTNFVPAWKANLTIAAKEVANKQFKEEKSDDFKTLFELDCWRKGQKAPKPIVWIKK